MKKTFYIYIALLGLLFTACRPEPIPINVEPAPPKLVLFTHAVPGNVMLVTLTKSFSALDGITEDEYQNLLVSGATVQVTAAGQTYGFFELGPGLYASFSPLDQAGQTLHLTASHNGETITATTQVLEQVSFTNVLPIIDKLPNDTTVNIQMDFTDPAQDNWYMINVYKRDINGNAQIDGVNFFANGSNLLERTILLSDDEFSGTYSQKHKFNGLHHTDSVVVTLSNISQDYYNYLSLRGEGGNFLNEINLEPVNYPSNVENGYGFFNAHFPDARFYDLGEY